MSVNPVIKSDFENSSMIQWSQTPPSKPSSPIRFTPTGKISHAKTRVYTQRYRKEWELLPDFQGWLTSIPYHPTRAYCLYCKKDLHAHRLSLLKHMCTMKHQRSALGKQQCNGTSKPTIQYIENLGQVENDKEQYMQEEYLEDSYIQYFVKKLDIPDESGIEYETRYEESYEEVEDEPSNIEYITEETDRDNFNESVVDLNSEEVIQEEHMEIVAESNDSQDIIICETTGDEPKQKSADVKILKSNDDAVIITKQKQSQTARKSMKRVVINPSTTVTSTPINKNVTNKSEFGTKFIVKNVKNNLQTLVVSSKKDDLPETIELYEDNENETELIVTENSENANKQIVTKKDTITTKASSSSRKSRVSTHVIDTNKGLPIGGLQVSIYKLVDGRWTFINESSTLASGHCNDLIDNEKTVLTCGRYKLHFDVDKYFTNRDIETIYPFIEIVFDVKNPNSQYHMPILLSPFGYTTYRG